MPTIFSIHASRHGTGKSNVIVNLAVTIARTGRRVGVLQAGSQISEIHTLFGVDEEHLDPIWNYYLWSGVSIRDVPSDLVPLLKFDQGAVVVMGSGIALTASNHQIKDVGHLLRQGFDSDILSSGLRDISNRLQLDYLLIDTEPGFQEEALFSMAIADVLVLMLCPNPQDFQDIAVLTDLAKRLEVPKTVLVANQISPNQDSETFVQRLQNTYDFPVAGILPFFEDLQVFASRAVFCQQYPKHAWCMGIGAIARQLIQSSAKGVAKLNPSSPDSSLSASSTPANRPRGFRMLDLLALPETERQLLNWMLRQDSVTLADAAEHTNQDAAILQEILGTLVERGFVQQTELEEETRYTPRLISRQGSTLPVEYWTLLEG